MPGFPPLPLHYAGPVANATRSAQAREDSGDHGSAVSLYEDDVGLASAEEDGLPGFLCARLAVLYRKLGRVEDEIVLLERYAMGLHAHAWPHRFESRLSKARALADRGIRGDSGALESVRAIQLRFNASRKTRLRPRALLNPLDASAPA